MQYINLKYCLIFFILIQYSCSNEAANFQILDLKAGQPSELSDRRPTTFSWKIKSDEANWKQDTYQIIVSGSEKKIERNEGDLWDSGKTISSEQLYIPYKGDPLVKGEKYYWKVRVWQNGKEDGRWSKVSDFTCPVSYPENWKAKWITSDYLKEAPMPLFRKSFRTDHLKRPVSASLFICGLGYYEAYLNGNKIGDRVLEPAQTNYDDYAFYSTYDIPVKEIKHENVLGIMLGNGWYNQYQVWSPAMAYGQPIAIAQLIVKYEDGSTDTICTDQSWKWTSGPVTSANIYAGENYDARLETADWGMPGANERNWKPVRLPSIFPPKIISQDLEPIRRMATLPTVRILEPSPKTWVFDFGQNFAGWVKLSVQGKKGQRITLRFAEEIDKNQNIDPTSTGVKATKVVQTDQYTCKGEGTEVWEPRFTYHGFRYVEVSGLDTRPGKDLLTGVVVCSSMQSAGTFSCSDAQINRLHDLALWTIKSNMHGIPTDCPHRERCGWTGDAHTVAPSLIWNLNARLFLTKYLFDMRSSGRLEKKELYFGAGFNDRSIVVKPAGIPTMIVPGKRTSGIASPDWGTAAVQIPWILFRQYGDSDILHEFYPDMKIWVDYIAAKFPDGIVNHGLGDWCPPGGNEKVDCLVALSSTAFHYLDLAILTRTAQFLGYTNDGMYYANKMHKVKERFNAQFFDAVKNSYGGQTANVLAIQLGLVPEGKMAELVESLVQDIHAKNYDFIQTGIFGLGRIFPALAENGAEDLAFRMLTKTGEHSFNYMWDKFQATTLWEVLPVDNAMSPEALNGRSHNHPMNAGYDEWFFRGIAGIHSDEKLPGFKKVVFRPYFTSKLGNAKATYESPYGTIVSDWKREGKNFTWNIQIPSNSSGLLYIPKFTDSKAILINGVLVDKSDLLPDARYPDFWVYNKLTNGKFRIEVM